MRDEHGQLQLSQAAADFRPGRGVYRSSYKNALRLTATETNMAYRTADYERWQQMDFVVGQKVCCSNNHPIPDICDTLAGKYPKDFKFVGWHPNCRCYVIPILKTVEEMAEDNDRILCGEEPESASENAVETVPENFIEWERDNADRIEAAKRRGSLPYFLKDNNVERLNNGGITKLGAVISNSELIQRSVLKVREVGNAIIKNNGHSSREAQMSPLYFGKAPESVIKFLKDRNIPLESNEMFITTKGISHAIRESKTTKGLAVSLDELTDFIANYADYTIFFDPVKEDLIFANKTTKFVVTPNYNIKKKETRVFTFISATQIKGNWSDHFSTYTRIKDAKH